MRDSRPFRTVGAMIKVSLRHYLLDPGLKTHLPRFELSLYVPQCDRAGAESSWRRSQQALERVDHPGLGKECQTYFLQFICGLKWNLQFEFCTLFVESRMDIICCDGVELRDSFVVVEWRRVLRRSPRLD